MNECSGIEGNYALYYYNNNENIDNNNNNNGCSLFNLEMDVEACISKFI